MSKIFFDKIPVLKVDEKINEKFISIVADIQNDYTREKAVEIDNMLFDLYNLSENERNAIGFIEIQ